MIRRLLIANRGEIAVRIARACREFGIESVAVYSDADAGALHTWSADRAVRLGPAPPSESYLSTPRILDAAKTTSADAVHPGYGFLSESHEFAAACEQAGLTFVGPPSSVIAKMGSKIQARRLMLDAGVPVVPGEVPADQSDAGLRRAIEAVGYPALVKPSEGGGGKGMHRISNAGDIAGAVQTARREATAAFGDGTLYVERLIEPARHVEVQIFGDGAGRVIHLWERDCSLQRRHQKVIEESPSPAIDEPLRTRMTAAATAAAEAVSYRSAGTVEFLVDLSQSGSETPFYFLEMNTRLQVEHPVTEGVTGVDLVRAQLLVASGGGLPWQTPPPPRGHSIEARIYAEDPARGFLPQSGRVLLYREPRMPGIRIDSGITEGCDVPVHYDPLLSKVIATAETRELAITRLAAALRRYPVLGVPTNIPFLLHLLNHPRFKAGDADTQFVESEGRLKDWLRSSEVPEPVRAAFAAHLSASGTGDVHAPYVGSGFSRTRTTGVIDPWSQK